MPRVEDKANKENAPTKALLGFGQLRKAGNALPSLGADTPGPSLLRDAIRRNKNVHIWTAQGWTVRVQKGCRNALEKGKGRRGEGATTAHSHLVPYLIRLLPSVGPRSQSSNNYNSRHLHVAKVSRAVPIQYFMKNRRLGAAPATVT